jgi:hypothetical protein
MSKLGKVVGAVSAAGVVINALLERSADGRVVAVKVGPLRVWDRERWEKRPLVRRIKRRISGQGDT